MTIQKLFLLFIVSLFFMHCTDHQSSPNQSADRPEMQEKAIFSKHVDTHTFANTKEAVTKHLSLNLGVDFEKNN